MEIIRANDECGNLIRLHVAVIHDDEVLTDLYLKLYFAELNAKDVSGCTPLHYAVRNNNLLIAQMLLHHGARVNDMTSAQLTPLHIAVSNRSKGMVNLLLNHGADVNPEENFQNKTPLFMAVEYGCIDIVRILLKYGASIAKATVKGTTLLHVAVRLGFTEMMQLLLQYSSMDLLEAKANLEGKTAIELAWDLQRYQIVDLIDQKLSYGLQPLHSKELKSVMNNNEKSSNIINNNKNNKIPKVHSEYARIKNLKKIPMKLLLRNGTKIPVPNVYNHRT